MKASLFVSIYVSLLLKFILVLLDNTDLKTFELTNCLATLNIKLAAQKGGKKWTRCPDLNFRPIHG